jgi:hypothetical protein
MLTRLTPLSTPPIDLLAALSVVRSSGQGLFLGSSSAQPDCVIIVCHCACPHWPHPPPLALHGIPFWAVTRASSMYWVVSRGLHSSTFWLNVSTTRCGFQWFRDRRRFRLS